jgi:hypothetical protein
MDWFKFNEQLKGMLDKYIQHDMFGLIQDYCDNADITIFSDDDCNSYYIHVSSQGWEYTDSNGLTGLYESKEDLRDVLMSGYENVMMFENGNIDMAEKYISYLKECVQEMESDVLLRKKMTCF